MNMAFVLLREPMVSSKGKCRLGTSYSLPLTEILKQPLNCYRRELDLIHCRMHETLSKNKIGSTLVAICLIPRK
jgi:hypothetical protein